MDVIDSLGNKISLLAGERIEPLGGGMRIIVSDEHKFWTDTVLLAHFSMPKRNERACELGTGCGAIPIIWCRNGFPGITDAVEIQQNACNMLTRSLELCRLSDRVNVINSDLRELHGRLTSGGYDIVVCNPPYKAPGAGIKSSGASQLVARHETECTLSDIVAAASDLLRFGGRLCMCQRPERLTDLMTAMRDNGIEPKRLRLVQQRTTKAPKLFLLEGRRGGRHGGLVIEPVLFIEGADGNFSGEMLDIYGEYKEGYL